MVGGVVQNIGVRIAGNTRKGIDFAERDDFSPPNDHFGGGPEQEERARFELKPQAVCGERDPVGG
jgi:hypothetical protein